MRAASHFFVARHGETDWNADGIVIGQADPCLNARGREQAGLLARFFEDKAVGGIWSSDLRRARETAEIIGSRLGHSPEMFTALREASFGTLEGQRMDELPEWRERREDKYGYRPPGGESYFEVEARLTAFLDANLARMLAGAPLLLVTHVGVLRVLYRLANKASVADAGSFDPDHLSVWAADLGPSGLDGLRRAGSAA